MYVSCCIFFKRKYFNTVHFWHLERPLWLLSALRSIWVSFVWLSKWGPSVKPGEKPRRVSDTRFGSGRTGLNTSSTLLITQVPNEFTADWTYSVGFFFLFDGQLNCNTFIMWPWKGFGHSGWHRKRRPLLITVCRCELAACHLYSTQQRISAWSVFNCLHSLQARV